MRSNIHNQIIENFNDNVKIQDKLGGLSDSLSDFSCEDDVLIKYMKRYFENEISPYKKFVPAMSKLLETTYQNIIYTQGLAGNDIYPRTLVEVLN